MIQVCDAIMGTGKSLSQSTVLFMQRLDFQLIHAPVTQHNPPVASFAGGV